MNSQYDQLGRLYDLAYDSEPGDDLTLYSRLAQLSGGHVLEMGAGSGRIAVPMAQAGFNVTCVEISSSMIKQAEERAGECLRAEELDRLNIIHADMSSVDLPGKYGLVIFPFSSLLELPDTKCVAESLKIAFRSMEDGATLVVDNFYYGSGGKPRKNAEIHEGRTVKVSEDSSLEFTETDWYDESTRITERWLYVDHIDSRGIATKRETFCIRRIYVSPSEMRNLFLETGFKEDSVELYGSFDCETSLDSPVFLDPENKARYQKARQVWVCKK